MTKAEIMTKYLDDAVNGQEQGGRWRARGSTVEVSWSPCGDRTAGIFVYGTDGFRLRKFEARLFDEFGGRQLDAQLAREIAARCREDFPA